MELNTHQTQILFKGGCLLQILSLKRGTNSKRGPYLKLGANSSIYGNLEKCRLFILLLLEFMPFFTEKVSEKGREREESGLCIQCSISKGKCLTDLIVYFVLDQTDPQTPRAPAWRLIPADTETAVEGRNKTLYCLAVGRLVLNIINEQFS